MLQTATVHEYKSASLSERPSEHSSWCPGSPVTSGNDVVLPPALSLTFASVSPNSLLSWEVWGCWVKGDTSCQSDQVCESDRWREKVLCEQQVDKCRPCLGRNWVCTWYLQWIFINRLQCLLLLSPFGWRGNWGQGREINYFSLVSILT